LSYFRVLGIAGPSRASDFRSRASWLGRSWGRESEKRCPPRCRVAVPTRHRKNWVGSSGRRSGLRSCRPRPIPVLARISRPGVTATVSSVAAPGITLFGVAVSHPRRGGRGKTAGHSQRNRRACQSAPLRIADRRQPVADFQSPQSLRPGLFARKENMFCPPASQKSAIATIVRKNWLG